MLVKATPLTEPSADICVNLNCMFKYTCLKEKFLIKTFLTENPPLGKNGQARKECVTFINALTAIKLEVCDIPRPRYNFFRKSF